jgi:phenylacetate-CoA ligase
MKFLPNIYGLETSEIERIQRDLLREAFDYAASASPYYRERLSLPGRYSESVRTLEDIRSLPLTSKRDIQRRNRDFWAVPANSVSEIVATTGTSGNPIYVPMTMSDVERLAENERRGFEWLGASPGDRYHVAVTLDNLFVAGLAYQHGLYKVGATVIRVGAQPTRRHLDLMRQLLPDGMVSIPSLLLALSRQAQMDDLDIKEFAPKKFLLIGDAVRGQDLSLNTLGRLITEAWGGDIHSSYGLTEAGMAFHECPAHNGLHSHPDLIFCEIVDEAGRALPQGELGELVITTLQIEGMPLLRYQTGDITFILSGPCPCGRNGVRIGPILGRRQHRLKCKGTTLYPKVIEDALLSVDGVENIVIEAHTGKDGTDRVVVRIGTIRKDNCFRKMINDTLYSKARVTPDVSLEEPAELEKVLHEGGRRKTNVFIDFRGS